ncbi:CRISPR-associated autoregulator DevR family [Schinkia azotoformans MEV2011]|uniref:CRISPR-associated autoregulator DevR family n=1 Tax=Schinkia azotoformans MEV2011 TaxID=1348973 RepID=A0A072NJC1_SCHAZ|nr:DevR family CRISPR-associated autoregulator [Schinkia azotoformans]KEF37799.1 CRISPR-associated autoregulator DevR family [Schinkia azotoformans MEV2011]MEC1693919.1 DevR family CRISPR-associated autoregulator [Schinkia azotoformans]MEC1716137.1 DevR family CRISPR-associated autoregulator [Schinkia azotoformans]MEC1724736.1 DevR family CRISPR-associated autoregulator [Schinkia azotoformans]MEC1740608.1 DevR family CRISPR-associated autoregulator [Schinkia azotoformans]
MTKEIFSISISGELSLDLHALNNERSEGNQTFTRQVTVLNKDGELTTVNAISGDMFKHIQAKHLHSISLEEGLNLCNGCLNFDSNRIASDKEFTSSYKKETPDEEVYRTIINKCVIDDIEGMMATANNKNVARKSVVEFGWVVGKPEKTYTNNYFHLKKATNASIVDSNKAENSGQNIFYRPLNTGVYATVIHLETSRIGLNEASLCYDIDSEERKKRYDALLKSVLYTFLKTDGAMRASQAPHLHDFKGIITASFSTLPAPSISPLNGEYLKEIENITANLNELIPDKKIEMWSFDSISDFTNKIRDLMGYVPGTIQRR